MPFTVTESLSTLTIRLRARQQTVHQSLVQAFTRIGIGLQGYIQRNKLEGQVLAHRTGKLTGSVRFFVYDGGRFIVTTVQAGGGVAPYGRVHEFGGTFTIPAHQSHSRTGREFTVRSHQARYPERSYMRTSLAEYQGRALAEVQRALGAQAL